jgi:putative transposase
MANRPRLDRDSLRVGEWPQLDDRALDGDAQSLFRLRRDAVMAYVAGDPIDSVVAMGVDRHTLRRLFARALRPHPDGRVWGWRALVPQARVVSYERQSPPKVLVHTKAGNAGAFSQLLARFPELEASLRRELTARRVTLEPGGERGRLNGVKAAAERFRHTCRTLGLTQRDYPLNQKDKAVRSLARTLRSWMDQDLPLATHVAGARVKPSSALRSLPERAALRAFDTVEFDAHKMDLRLKVVDVDPTGGEQVWEIERVWLLAIIDVATRCILGWTLSLARECNRTHVVETIHRAITPQHRPTLSLPGLRLLPEGGFVSDSIEDARYACWRQLRLDNARAHLATTSLDVLCETLGCTADFGPAYQPDDRPFIERFFGTVTQTLSRRLPGALPGAEGAKAALARLREPKGSLRLLVTAQELDELLSVAIWNYHGTPHSSHGGHTPLSVMRRQVLGEATQASGTAPAPMRLRRLPSLIRAHPALLHDPVMCKVHGNVALGQRPYITFMHVRYTSKELAVTQRLVGQRLRVHVDPSDLRELTAVTEDGHILQPLLASSVWRHEPHSLWLRREFFKAKRARELNVEEGQNPIEAFVEQRRRKANKRKRAASDIARVQHERRQSQARPPPDGPSPSPPPQSPALNQLVKGPVKAKKLHIPPGFAR